LVKNNYFDYVSAGFIDDLCSKIAADAELDPEDFFSFREHIDSFFKNFGITDVILFRKSGKPASAFSNACKSLFKPDCSAQSVHFNHPVRYYKGVEIEAENENVLYSAVRKERPNADFIVVRSSDEKVIRAAADSSDVDLVIPVSYLERGTIPVSYSEGRVQNGISNLHVSVGQINHIVAKIAKEKKTAFGFDIYPFLQTKGYRRSKILADCMEMIPILRKYRVPVLLFSGAGSFYDARGPYECEAFGSLLGLSREETAAAVSFNSAEIIELRKKQQSGEMIMSGVEIVENDLND
jgi:ribonuclease P/MRP protein subunit RPP1